MAEIMNNGSCIGRIRDNLDTFSPVGKKIAESVLKSPEQCIHMTVMEFAEYCSTSEASIVRFCKSIGYSGFHEMKIYLASELSLPREPMLSKLQDGDDELTVLQKVFANEILSLQKTLETIDINVFRQVVNSILYARRIEFYAYGNTRPIIIDAKYRFLKIGIDCYAGSDMSDSLIRANMLAASDVVIGVSHSGSTRQVCKAMQIAKEHGATTICITGFPKSPITHYSDFCLYAYVDSNSDSQTTSGASRSAEMAILDAIYAAVAVKRMNRSMEFIRMTDEILMDEKI